jgi:hypothetical protein
MISLRRDGSAGTTLDTDQGTATIPTMVRTISAELQAAANWSPAAPALRVVLRDGLDRPAAEITTGEVGRSAATQLADGTAVRAYVSQPSVDDPATVYRQNIGNVSDGGTIGPYSAGSTGAEGQAGVALTVIDGTLFLFYQRLSDHAVCYQTSVDGVTWSDEAAAISPGVHAWGIAAAAGVLAVAIDDPDDSAQALVLYEWTGSVWTALSTWPSGPIAIRGLSMVTDGAGFVIAMGSPSRSGGALSPCVVSFDGSEWSSLTAVRPIDDPALGLSCPYPSIGEVAGRLTLSTTIYDDGSASGSAGSITEMWTSPDGQTWHLWRVVSEPSFQYGGNITGLNGSGFLLFDAGTLVPSRLAAGLANPDLDVSTTAESITIREPASDTVRAVIALVDDDGAFVPRPEPADGPLGAFRAGAQVDVSLGYGGATVVTHSLSIERIESRFLIRDPALRRTLLFCSNRAEVLARPVAVPLNWSGLTVWELVEAIAYAGGIAAVGSPPGTPQFSQIIGSFGLNPAGTYLDALEALAHVFGFEWFVDENDVLQVREPSSDDEPGFTVGAVAGRVRRVNFISDTGPGAWFEDSTGGGDCSGLYDVTLSPDQAALRAALTARRMARERTGGRLTTGLQPAAQPLDVVSIAGEEDPVRIRRIVWIVDLRRMRFEQVMEVEGV